MAMLLLLRGVSGSGKSTLAAKLSALMFAIHVEADQYFELEGSYKFDPNKLHAAHKWCQDNTRNYLLAGEDVIVSNTSTTEAEVKVYEDIAKETGSEFFSVIKENRHEGVSIHDVPDYKVSQQRSRLILSVKL